MAGDIDGLLGQAAALDAPPMFTGLKSGPGSGPRIRIQPSARIGVGDEASKLALIRATHRELIGVHVVVRKVERDGLWATQACTVEQGKECFVPYSRRTGITHAHIRKSS